MIFIYFFCTKIAGTRHVLFVQLHSILKGARRFGFQTKTTPFASRACGPDCEPQRAFRGQPPQAALRPRSRLRATLGQDAPHGRGVKGSIRLAPDQTDRRLRLPRVFSASAEARHPPRRPCGLPHGLGGSAPSPCAPPRQAGRPSPFGHCVVGFCGSIRLAPDQTDRRRAPSSGLLG